MRGQKDKRVVALTLADRIGRQLRGGIGLMQPRARRAAVNHFGGHEIAEGQFRISRLAEAGEGEMAEAQAVIRPSLGLRDAQRLGRGSAALAGIGVRAKGGLPGANPGARRGGDRSRP